MVVSSLMAAVLSGVAISRCGPERRADVPRETPAYPKDPPIESDGLYGEEVASMGSAFHGITVGVDAAEIPLSATAERIRLAAHDDALRVQIVEGNDGTIAEVRADFGYQPRCRELHDALVTAWGTPTVDTVWLGTSHRRASYEESEMEPGRIVCQLAFDRYVDTAEWVAAIPLSLSSTFRTNIAEQIGEHSYIITGSGPTLGATSEGTDYQATIVNDKVVGILVMARHVSGIDDDELRTKLVERLKARPDVAKTRDGTIMRWKHPVSVVLQHGDGFISVAIGKP
jgi:hypothetical protein